MRTTHLAYLPAKCLVFSVVLGLSAQQPPRTLSTDALSAESAAIYKAVLLDYTREKNQPQRLNVSKVTIPLRDLAGSCGKGIAVPSERSTIHALNAEALPTADFVLVSPYRQQKVVAENDPQKTIQQSTHDGSLVTEEQVDESVKKAFDSGLFTFSEIAFDASHTHAALQYTFECGMLCGHGNTVRLVKVNGRWKVAKVCGGWIS